MKRIKYSMIPEKLHLVVTGETGEGMSFVIRRDYVAAFLAVLLFILTALAFGTWLGFGFLRERNVLAERSVLQADALQELSEDFDRILKEQLTAQHGALQIKLDAYAAQVRNLKKEQEELICRHEEELAVTGTSNAEKIADLLAELEQARQEKQDLLEKTAVRLDERSRMIESVMSRIGVDVKVGSNTDENSGGPFIAVDRKYSEHLLNRSDQYLQTIRKMPLGYPMKGRVTSGFGRRSDPINHRLAFHAGIDLKGPVGRSVRATADGTVKQSSYDRYGLGNHVILQHGNGYETAFGHLSKRLVRRGDKVQRGQVIGRMGNTGRSTGPHLHYEVRYRGKPVDPIKYLSVAKLSFTVPE
jgi:murein DD-endopeptidase MepM/ murein hydrolase activator NlpD